MDDADARRLGLLVAASMSLPVLRSLSMNVTATAELGRILADALAVADEGAGTPLRESVDFRVRELVSLVTDAAHVDPCDSRITVLTKMVEAVLAARHPVDAIGLSVRSYVEGTSVLGGSSLVGVIQQTQRAQLNELSRAWGHAGVAFHGVSARQLRWRALNWGENLDRCLHLSELIRLGEPGYFRSSFAAIRRAVNLLEGNVFLRDHRAEVESALNQAQMDLQLPLTERNHRRLDDLAAALVKTLPKDETKWDSFSLLVVGLSGLLREIDGAPAEIEAIDAARGLAYEFASIESGISTANQIDYPFVVHKLVIDEVHAEEQALTLARASHASGA